MRSRRILNFVLDHLVWLVLIIVLTVFSLAIDNFFQARIFVNILRQATFVGIISVGLSMAIIFGHMDLSVEAVMTFSAMLAAMLVGENGAGMGLDINIGVTLLISLVVGALIGLINGCLIIKLGINAFIVTLASFIGIQGFALVISGGRSVYGLPDAFRAVAVA